MNDYNLNILSYIDLSEPEDLHDFDAHFNGGIPDTDIDALDTYWAAFPTLRNVLFKANGRPGYSDPLVETQRLKMTIRSHIDFKLYRRRVNAAFTAWREAHEPRLLGIDVGTVPRKIIETLSEDLLTRFSDLPLFDQYNVYQKLMDYWDEVMQDDIYLIATDGWVEAAKPREVIQNKQVKETPALVIKENRYKMNLIPPTLIVARYFAAGQNAIKALREKQATAVQILEEYIEEHTSEDGLLADVLNSSGNITASNVEILTPDLMTRHETQNDDKRNALEHCLSLRDARLKAEKAVEEAQLALDAEVLAHYTTLTEDEIKVLVVEDKWIANVQSAVVGEVQRLTQALTERVQKLEERYAQSLLVLEEEVERYRARVAEHLQNLGTE